MRVVAKYVWIFLFIAFVGSFLFADMSGLIGQAPVTTSTVVAKVNGDEIPYLAWENLTRSLAQQQEQQTGRSLNLDERLQLEQQAFDQLVTDLLLQQEYERRGIIVTNDEIVAAARYSPPPQFQQAAEFQTEGRFDQAKYERYLASPLARQQGLLAQLESYYRAELPRSKLFSQLIADTWLSDEQLFQVFRDERDSARVSYVALRPTPAQVAAVTVSEAEVKRYYDRYKGRWERSGRAVVSFVSISRIPVAADTAAVVARLRELRAEIVGGASFADVARRESEDSVSAREGGDLGRGTRGRFVPAFENAAFALRVGQVSEPVETQFGWHLIQATDRKGDTLAVRHILLRVRQGDSTATLSDRAADRLAGIAAGASDPRKFDEAAEALGLLVTQIPVTEGQTATYQGLPVGGVSGWAFSGVQPGETSDLFDDEQAYYLVRLDSLTRGGEQPLALVRDDIAQALRERKAVDVLVPQGEALLADARNSTLEAMAAKAGLTVDTTRTFTRLSFVEGLGYSNEAVGAAFGLDVGTTAMVRTIDAVFLMRVNHRVGASREAFEAQKATQRQQLGNAAREQRIRTFLDNLRREATIVDRRRDINAALRRQVVE
ncbi:MAG: SurA N-terminal domain-containing protein [Gemmatimonadaceae bacterium]